MQNKDGKLRITIDTLFSVFDNHLSDDSNARIVLSAKFGMGKTYFLKEFFKSKESSYETFHLFPTNYQIAANEDIIEYLKYDLLVDIVNRKENVLKKNDYSSIVDLQRLAYIWGNENKAKIFHVAASYIPKLGKPLQDTVVLAEDFLKFKKELESGEEGFIEKHLAQIKKRNILETDELSELIKNKISEIKKDKFSVLILDDLDRVDPEHIFRILNIFSSHFDTVSDEKANKFGFDKIIIVADVRNLKSIFQHKFGAHADFGGYFDKFYSNEVFYLKNELLIKEAMDQLISHLRVEDKASLSGALESSGFLRIIFKEIITRALEIEGKEKINLRQLFSGTRTQLPALKSGTYGNGFIQTKNTSIVQFTNISISALISMVGGDKNDLVAMLESVKAGLKDIPPKGGEDRIYRLLSQPILNRISRFGITGLNPENIKSLHNTKAKRPYHMLQ